MRRAFLSVVAGLFVGFGFAYYQYHPSPDSDFTTEPSNPKRYAPQADNTDEALIAENHSLREQNDRLIRELEESERGAAKMAKAVLSIAISETQAPEPGIDSIDAELRNLTLSDLLSRIEGLNAIERKSPTFVHHASEESAYLMMEIIRRGSDGLRFLIELAARPRPDPDQVIDEENHSVMVGRATGLEALSTIRSVEGLEALITLMESGRLEDSGTLYYVRHHLKYLPHEAVEPFVPQLFEALERLSAQPSFGRHFVSPAAHLAFRYGHNGAYRLLSDPRLLEVSTQAVVELAAEEHSRRAHQYVRWIAENHIRESDAERALELLEAW